MPSATIPTTVATGMRNPRMQGTPPICLAFVVIRVNLMAPPQEEKGGCLQRPLDHEPTPSMSSWRLQNKPAQIRVLRQIADVAAYIGRVDLHDFARTVRGGEGNIVEHPLHHGLQP